jgi:methylenetetrahydrofolate dehydrogenase (NADP+) / methenyltetrahydrofolate cyclohydrolase
MIIFDGTQFAQLKEKTLKEKIEQDFNDRDLTIAAILFSEDAGSKLYTRLKNEAADRIGIKYVVHEYSLIDDVEIVQEKILELGNDPEITGIIIQKPWRTTWLQAQNELFFKKSGSQKDSKQFETEQYNLWWHQLTEKIKETKDVDGLHPHTIEQIKQAIWKENHKVLPATCRAVLNILNEAQDQITNESDQQIAEQLLNGKYLIIGKSELLGIPLYYELKRQGREVEILASRELEERMKSGKKLLDASVIISATGKKGLITGDMLGSNVVIIDVGEPNPDIDFESVSSKAIFFTPVPGGVGPVTVVSLLENCLDLAYLH